MTARAAVVLVLLAPALAGCVAPTPAAVVDGFDPAVPHCVGDCGRIVDDSPFSTFAPFIVVNPEDPAHVVVAYMEHSKEPSESEIIRNRVAVSKDGGSTWTAKAIPSGPSAPPDDPLAPYTVTGYSPFLLFLPDGTLLLSADASNDQVPGMFGLGGQVSPGNTLYTMRSSDGGITWGDVRFVGPGEGVFVQGVAGAGAAMTYNGDPRLAIGPDGGVLLVWTQLLQGHPEEGFDQDMTRRLVSASSQDGGLTWSDARVIDAGRQNGEASAVIGGDGVWRVAYRDGGSDELRFAESRDAGGAWDARTLGETAARPVLRKQALDSGVERLLLASSTTGAQGDHWTELTRPDDGGATWAPALQIDAPLQGIVPLLDIAAGGGESVWITLFDGQGASTGEGVYLALKVADGVVGEPLVLATTGSYIGQQMLLAARPNGDALATWVVRTGADRAGALPTPGDSDVMWAHITGGDAPVAQHFALPAPPAGLDEPVEYEFTGHLDVAGCYAEVGPALEPFVRHEMEFEFDVPADTRYIKGTLEWSTHGPPASPTDLDDLDVFFYDAKGDRWRGADDVPETFEFEIRDGDQGKWTAFVTNCENPPTDFTLEIVLS